MSILLFFIGLWLGGIIGVFTMCLFKFREKVQKKKGMGPVYYVKRTSKSKVRKNQEREVKCK